MKIEDFIKKLDFIHQDLEICEINSGDLLWEYLFNPSKNNRHAHEAIGNIPFNVLSRIVNTIDLEETRVQIWVEDNGY